MNSLKESIVYYVVKTIGAIFRILPEGLAYPLGRLLGCVGYYVVRRRRYQAYVNIRTAFADSKTPQEINKITRDLFVQYGQNFVDLFRIPLLKKEKFSDMVAVEGQEHIWNALKKGKGVIFMAMHFGSWEMASLACYMLDFPYNLMYRTQKKYAQLDNLLNSYRAAIGYDLLDKQGMGTRDFLRSLKNNEVVGMVADQGGREGVRIPFMGKEAPMSVGAIRMAIKWDVPICFSVIYREKNAKHRMIIHAPLDVKKSGDLEKDLKENLMGVVKTMEGYVRERPQEYMWFYKIWKYAGEEKIAILSDGKTGHLRQSQQLARLTQKALLEKMNTRSTIMTLDTIFKSKGRAGLLTLFDLVWPSGILSGRIPMLKWALTQESYEKIIRTKPDYLISCGSSIAAVNDSLARINMSRNMVIQKPSVLPWRRFERIFLPQHDVLDPESLPWFTVVTRAAMNVVDEEYLQEQSKQLIVRYSHLLKSQRRKIGVFVGGTSKNVYLTELQMKVLSCQLKEIANGLGMDIMLTTSRRTPAALEQILFKELKKDPRCLLFITPNKDYVPEAVGGILGLSDIVVVSGDSISMMSEAASSGKKTIVFFPETKEYEVNKHLTLIEKLSSQGYILSTQVKDLGQCVLNMTKNRIQTQKLDDASTVYDAVKRML